MMNKEFDVILFDLDGTLTDPGEGITNSVAYALNKYGIVNTDRTELYPFIGPPLYASFMKYYGFTEEEAVKAVDYYREYYKDKGIFENRLYDGIDDVLKRLTEAGKVLLVATSKPEVFAKRILSYFGIDKYFAVIAGATMDGSLIEKSDIISYAFKNSGFSKENALMVGDRSFDILGAKEQGVTSAGVLWGYGSLEELKSAGADMIFERVEDIEKILL